MAAILPRGLCTPVNTCLPTAGSKVRPGSGVDQALSSQFDKRGRGSAGLLACLCHEGSVDVGERQEPAPSEAEATAQSSPPLLTSCMNFLHTGRISLLKVALNIMHCFSWGVRRKISCTSRRISGREGRARNGASAPARPRPPPGSSPSQPVPGSRWPHDKGGVSADCQSGESQVPEARTQGNKQRRGRSGNPLTRCQSGAAMPARLQPRFRVGSLRQRQPLE